MAARKYQLVGGYCSLILVVVLTFCSDDGYCALADPITQSAVFAKRRVGAVITHPPPLAAKGNQTLVSCASYCNLQAQCVSIDYTPGTGQCHLHGLASVDVKFTPSSGSYIYGK